MQETAGEETGSPAGEETEDGVAQAQATVDEFLEWTPGSMAETVPGPLSEAPPTDRSIYWMQCGVPVCQSIGDAIEEAAGVVGWEFRRIDMGSTPDTIEAAWNQAVSDPPDLIMSSGVDAFQIEEQLAQLEEMGVPHIAGSVSDDPGQGNIGVIAGQPEKEKMGELNAAWVVADTGGDANVVYFDLSDFPVLVAKREAFQARLAELCSDCTVDVQNVAVTDIGRQVPGQVTSYLQANPDVDYIVYGTGAISIGVHPALQEAGFEDVKAVTSAGNNTHWEEIAAEGILQADVPNNDPVQGWQFVDRAARYFVGDPTMGPEFLHEEGLSTPLRFATAETIQDPAQPFAGPENYRDQFRELWHLTE